VEIETSGGGVHARIVARRPNTPIPGARPDG
jgi:hypothetical protein